MRLLWCVSRGDGGRVRLMVTAGASSRPDAPTAHLAEDLRELVRTAGLDIAEFVEIGPVRGAPYGKHTYRLRLGDGGSLKGRTCHSSRRAARYARLSRRLDPHRFPRVVSRSGNALLEEWVEGRPLTTAEWTNERVRECGEILGRLHRNDRRPPPRWRTPALELRRLQDRIGGLVEAGALTRHEADWLCAAAEASLPPRIDWGLVHGDFCAANIVIRPSGTLAVVDNESLDLGALDGDLARTWYRWPQDHEQRRVFAEGVERHRCTDGFRASRTYWIIRELTGSARFWLQADPSLKRPLEELRSFARSATAVASFWERAGFGS